MMEAILPEVGRDASGGGMCITAPIVRHARQ
jgi:hypothetical protein